VVYPKELCLVLFLFLIFINDTDGSVSNSLLKFTSDTKLFSVNVSDINDVNKLQTDLKDLYKWSEDRLILFNVDTCRIMQIGNNNGKANMK
jgi:hypothetical protein